MKLKIKESNKAIIVVDEDKDLICDIVFTANGMNLSKIQEIVHKVNNYDEMLERYEKAIDEFYELGYEAPYDFECLKKFRLEQKDKFILKCEYCNTIITAGQHKAYEGCCDDICLDRNRGFSCINCGITISKDDVMYGGFCSGGCDMEFSEM